MLFDDNFQIIWTTESVSLLKNPVPDMWYLEGSWVSANTPAASEFEAAVQKSKLDDVFNNPEKGIEVFLQDNKGHKTLAVIISLADGNIFIRRIAVSLKPSRQDS